MRLLDESGVAQLVEIDENGGESRFLQLIPKFSRIALGSGAVGQNRNEWVLKPRPARFRHCCKSNTRQKCCVNGRPLPPRIPPTSKFPL